MYREKPARNQANPAQETALPNPERPQERSRPGISIPKGSSCRSLLDPATAQEIERMVFHLPNVMVLFVTHHAQPGTYGKADYILHIEPRKKRRETDRNTMLPGAKSCRISPQGICVQLICNDPQGTNWARRWERSQAKVSFTASGSRNGTTHLASTTPREIGPVFCR